MICACCLTSEDSSEDSYTETAPATSIEIDETTKEGSEYEELAMVFCSRGEYAEAREYFEKLKLATQKVQLCTT